MSARSLGLSAELHDYLLRVGVREPDVLRRLRDETSALPQANMQIAPEQGAFMALLAELIGVRRCIELGTFTGYSALAVARTLPSDGRMVCCDVSPEWTDVARRYWAEAGVADRIELRLAPALDSLDALLDEGAADSFDFGFVDAVKTEYAAYYDRLIQLIRPGGLMLFDNVLQDGDVARPDVDNDAVRAIREFNDRLADDDRVTIAMVPIADGLTLARRT